MIMQPDGTLIPAPQPVPCNYPPGEVVEVGQTYSTGAISSYPQGTVVGVEGSYPAAVPVTPAPYVEEGTPQVVFPPQAQPIQVGGQVNPE